MHKRAFTLIELLVVIAIIAILASLAMPIYSKVLERSHGIQDANNLRQLGVGFTAYLGDNGDTMPTTASLQASSNSNNNGNSINSWAGLIGPASASNYVSDWHAFQSPFDSRPYQSSSPENVSYGMNTYIASCTNPTATSFHYPSSLCLLGPFSTQVGSNSLSFTGNSQTNTITTPGNQPGIMNDLQLMNVLYQDGHVASITKTNFNNQNYMQSTAGQSEFWQPLAQ